jgi:phenylalanyl-tRNA synthetase beta chain
VNILVTALADRGGSVRTVGIHRDGKTFSAPDLNPGEWTLDPDGVNRWLGTNLSVEEMIGCLAKTGHGAVRMGQGLRVFVPSYRGDVLHPVDLAEDVAIGYGFERFGQALPKRATFAREDDLVAFGREVKSVLIGLGYFEVVTLSLSNPREQAVATMPGSEAKAVALRNPVSEEHMLLRTSLIPSLMAILRKNKHRELPQKLFEVGDVVLDLSNRTHLAGVAIHAKASFTEMKSVVQSILAALGLEADVEPVEHPTFLRGRCASLSSGGEGHLGLFGEVSPAALEVFELRYPAGAFELDLERLMTVSRARR